MTIDPGRMFPTTTPTGILLSGKVERQERIGKVVRQDILAMQKAGAAAVRLLEQAGKTGNRAMNTILTVVYATVLAGKVRTGNSRTQQKTGAAEMAVTAGVAAAQAVGMSTRVQTETVTDLAQMALVGLAPLVDTVELGMPLYIIKGELNGGLYKST